MGKENKRTYYKKPWFWIVGIILIIASTINPPKSTMSSKTATNGTITPPATLESGTYKIGTDIKAGEYVLIVDSEATVKTLDFNGLFVSCNLDASSMNRIVVKLIDGQYLELKANSCKIYPIAEAPKTEIKDGKLTAGIYKAGLDFPAGEYRVYNYTRADFAIYSDSSFNTPLSRNYYTGKEDFTFSEGEIIKVMNEYIVVTPIAQTENTDNFKGYAKSAGSYISNVLHECVIVADGNSNCTVTKDGNKIFTDYFSNRLIVTFEAKQDFDISSGLFYPIDHAPKVEIVDGKLPEGMYKVGLDFPQGSYTLVQIKGFNGRYTISSNSSHLNENIIKTESFTGTKTVTLKDGQYIEVSGAYIIVK